MKNLMTEMGRQGDVLIRRANRAATATAPVERENGRVILAHGEATGHAHALASRRVTMFMDTGAGTGRRYIEVSGAEPAALAHEEHSTVLIPPGDFEVIRQREYSPEAIRNVAD